MKRTFAHRAFKSISQFFPSYLLCVVLSFGLFFAAFSNAIIASPIIPIHTLKSQPVLDGAGDDWSEIAATEIKLRQTATEHTTAIDNITLKGGVFADRVYFYITWADDSKNVEHKPFIWNDAKKRYVPSKVLEDRLAMQFEMLGDYTTNWFSGNSFTADMWHWKASRSNPLGLVHDKQTIISKTKLLRAYSAKTAAGESIYILRPSDEGDRLYKSTRYKEQAGAKMPKYILTENPQGSIADVTVSGVWQDGRWHLEISRLLDTQHADDVVFHKGQQVKGGIAVFNSTGDEDHSISDTLIFQF